MSKKIRIIEAANQLSLGGTEYALQLYSKYLNKDLFDVTVVAMYNGGERVKLIEDLGISVVVLNGDLKQFETLIQNTDVFHWHGSGILDKNIFSILEKNKPKLVVQTNVFGDFDNSQFYKLIDYDLYISEMILVRRMHLDSKLPHKHSEKRKVLPYPIDVEHLQSLMPSEEEVLLFKKENNLVGNFVVGRIGRADDHKFDIITLDGFAELSKVKENARFLLVGATPKMIKRTKDLKVFEKVLFLDTSSDLRRLLLYYKSLDVFLAASNIGESFGMVIAEAMFSEVPVVTICTPDRDNAQIELVDNGINGFVVPRLKKKIGLALVELHDKNEARIRFSKSAKEKVLNNFAAKNIIRSFETLILSNLYPKQQFDSNNTLIVDFSQSLIDNYEKRCNNLFGGLSRIERIYLFVSKLTRYFSFSYFKHYLKLLKFSR